MSCKKPREHSRKKPRCARIDIKILALSCRAFQKNTAEQQHWSLTRVIVIAASLTVRVNFPINDQLMTWSAATPPDNIIEIWSPWEKAHTVRTILCLGAFALEVAAWSVFALQNADASRN